ncbi:MAG: LLM class flavin-dependent oxidoreductase, partial [Chloroflexi bacterium]|nr:LLM class flavin-dependent oxidoreductase [Chloroflexota bacterium]
QSRWKRHEHREKDMTALKFGFTLPFSVRDARSVAGLACEAERAGWDGFFVGEALWHMDAWVLLTAAAMCAGRIRLGTMLSPLPSMNPRKVASQTATLDNLSNGRVILSMGLGAVWMGYQAFPDEVTDTKVRAEMLDEEIDILTLLYRGKPFDYDGRHYHLKLTAVDAAHYPPPPVQQPRIPLWVVGVWPRMKSMQRVLRCDGVIPAKMNPAGQFVELQPEDVRQMKAYVDANRTLTTPFDIAVEGKALGLERALTKDKLRPWIEAGATWWLESMWDVPSDELVTRLRQGPPRLE